MGRPRATGVRQLSTHWETPGACRCGDSSCVQPAPTDALWRNRPHPEPVGCACCSPALSQLADAVGLDLADNAAAYRASNPPKPYNPGHPTLFTNAGIVTMAAGAVQDFEAMLIRDGRVHWLGSNADAGTHADAQTTTIDCQGRTILPGFIEPHMHLAPIAMLGHFENIGPFRFSDIESALDRLREVGDVTDEPWIIGRQFDPSLQEGPDTLTKDMLDRVSATKPVFVYNASLHFGYCNSVALELAGVDRDTPDPEGSAFGRDPNGDPNGVLKGGPAMGMVARHNPVLRGRDLVSDCLAVFRHANSVGFTTLCDQGTGLFQGDSELDLYRTLRESGEMTARFRYSFAHARERQWLAAGVNLDDKDPWLRPAGWKIVSDGSNQGRTGLQREPFLNDTSRGIAYIEKEALNDAVAARLEEGWPVVVHANGDAAIDNVLDAFEQAAARGLEIAERRCRIEHCSILHDEQIERIRKLGLSPSFLIGHVYYWGKAFRDDVFGADKAALLDRTAACEAAGIRWTLHSDEPVTEMNPLRCIQNAVTRDMWKAPGEKLAGDEAVPVAAALRAMTLDAAWQCHSDHEIGSLEVGKLADFVVLAADPRDVPSDAIEEVTVLETWVNGNRVFQNGPGGDDR